MMTRRDKESVQFGWNYYLKTFTWIIDRETDIFSPWSTLQSDIDKHVWNVCVFRSLDHLRVLEWLPVIMFHAQRKKDQNQHICKASKSHSTQEIYCSEERRRACAGIAVSQKLERVIYVYSIRSEPPWTLLSMDVQPRVYKCGDEVADMNQNKVNASKLS